MRSRTSTWFETKIKFQKLMDTGEMKKVTETYVVDALSFSEAESSIIKEMTDYISGDMEVKAIKIAPYGEVFISDVDNEDKWYKVKVAFITIDEKTEKEKKCNTYYLVQGSSVENAKKNVDEVFSTSMMDYSVVSISETDVMDVFEHKNTVRKDIDKTEVSEETNSTPFVPNAPNQ